MKTLLIKHVKLLLLISIFSFVYTNVLLAQVGVQQTPSPCTIGNGIVKNVIYKVNGILVPSLRNYVNEGDYVEVTFSLNPGTKKTRFSLVAYHAVATTFSEETAVHNEAYDYDMQEFEAGTHTLSVFVPKNYFEVDFVYGCIIWKFGPKGTSNYYGNRIIEQANGGKNVPCIECDKKVTICHVPQGNPGNAHSITISQYAAKAHIGRHGGDHYGICTPEIQDTIVAISCDVIGVTAPVNIQTITLLMVYYRLDPVTYLPMVSTIDSSIKVITVNAATAAISLEDFTFGYDTVCAFINGKDTCKYYYMAPAIYGAYINLAGNTSSTVLNSSWTGSNVTVYGKFYANPDYETCDRLIDVALPVKLTRFEATKIEPSIVKLEWTTASETNNDYIAIEKSSDIANWKEVCRVKSDAQGGNSQHVHDYSCYDHSANEDGQNIVYYRPKQVDLNGTFEYHNTIRIRLMDAAYATEIQSVYPNPATDRLNIKYNASENGIFYVKLISIEGKALLESKFVAKPGIQTYDLDLMEDKMRPGLYVLEIRTDNEVFRQKVYKM